MLALVILTDKKSYCLRGLLLFVFFQAGVTSSNLKTKLIFRSSVASLKEPYEQFSHNTYFIIRIIQIHLIWIWWGFGVYELYQLGALLCWNLIKLAVKYLSQFGHTQPIVIVIWKVKDVLNWRAGQFPHRGWVLDLPLPTDLMSFYVFGGGGGEA